MSSPDTTGGYSRRYPDGVRELAAGGTWDTIAGQPSDVSEMARLLARLLSERGAYDSSQAKLAFPLGET